MSREEYFCAEGKPHYNYDAMIYYDVPNRNNAALRTAFAFPGTDEKISQRRKLKNIILKYITPVTEDMVDQVIKELKNQKENNIQLIINKLFFSEENKKEEIS